MQKFKKTYLPNTLTRKDRKKQIKMLNTSRKMYKLKKYYTRKPVSSFKSKTSNHITNAKRIYKVDSIKPSIELSKKTGCSIKALQSIVKKGEGAYYSSGSRPNQTPKSWGLARLASAITSGNAVKYDYNILYDGCDHNKKAYILAKKYSNK